MSARSCFHCGRQERLRLKVHGQGPDGELYCRVCGEDIAAGRPPGSTVARHSLAVKTLPCPHCHAKRGELCHGPGLVRFIHARRRDAAAELARAAREDVAYGN